MGVVPIVQKCVVCYTKVQMRSPNYLMLDRYGGFLTENLRGDIKPKRDFPD
jgi:hypothetical protein